MQNARMPRLLLATLAAAGLGISPATARNIVLTNDDGLTSNVLALYQALKAAGHDVIVSVPCLNQSGMSAAAYFGRPIPPLGAACRNNAAAPGDLGAGPMTRADLPARDFHYVAGTPVMAALYGIDVAASKRWNRAPDLVLSGPNEGQNLGSIVLSSGTVGIAQHAALRGIPAIALSAGINSAGTAALDNPVSKVVAARTLELVRRLDRQTHGKPMLPAGLLLNVNFPDNPEGAPWRMSRIGRYNAYLVRFTDNMARDPSEMMQAMARQQGAAIAEQPGITLDTNTAAPLPDQANDESAVYKAAIAVSPMRAGYDAGKTPPAALRTLLRGLNRERGQ